MGATWKRLAFYDEIPAGGVKAIHQASHGFVVGNILYLAAGVYTKAKADAAATSEVVGIVSAVAAGTDDFTILNVGYVSGLSGLTAGTIYFLSCTTAGALTATEPTTEGHVSKPVLIADSTTSGYFFNMRGAVVGGGSTAYVNTFVNGGLAAGILTVTHNFGHQYPNAPVVIDNNGKVVIPDEITYTSTTALAIDLSSYGAIAGTWRVVVLDSGASQNVVNWATTTEVKAQAESAKAVSPLTLAALVPALGTANHKHFVNAAGTASEYASGVSMVQYTHDISVTGSQALTGAGFKPSMVRVMASDGTETNGSIAEAWIGGKFMMFEQDSGVGVGKWYCALSSGGYIIAININGSNYAAFSITSWDADGVTGTWAKTGSPTGTCTFMVTYIR
jgi:hypothetical protein